MSMETDILSQRNRDKIKDLTKRIEHLEVPKPDESGVIQESSKQIIKIWDAITMVAEDLAEVKLTIVNIQKVMGGLFNQVDVMEAQLKVPKKKSNGRKKQSKAA